VVATTVVAARIERGLTAVLGETEYLWELDQRWERLTELEQVDFSLEWDHLMASYLVELDELYWGGEMTPEQQVRYLGLLDKLKQASPIVERRNLYRPPVLLET
jgi:hypothetical protein